MIFNAPKNKFSGNITGSHTTKWTSSFKRKRSLNSVLTGEDISVETVIYLNDKQEEEVRVEISTYDTALKKWVLKQDKVFKKW
jgi:hypothetical protein